MIRDTIIDSRSYRSFKENIKIHEDDLREILDTVRLCPSAQNLQPLKYKLVTSADEIEDALAVTKWAGALPDTKLPPEGHHPTAFIAVCCDTKIVDDPTEAYFDAGIAAQSIMLLACEKGFGGCILRAFDPDELSKNLRIPKKCEPVCLIALGVPDETVIICEIPKSGETKYFRDKANLHFVPKRSLESIIIE